MCKYTPLFHEAISLFVLTKPYIEDPLTPVLVVGQSISINCLRTQNREREADDNFNLHGYVDDGGHLFLQKRVLVHVQPTFTQECRENMDVL